MSDDLRSQLIGEFIAYTCYVLQVDKQKRDDPNYHHFLVRIDQHVDQIIALITQADFKVYVDEKFFVMPAAVSFKDKLFTIYFEQPEPPE